MTSTQQRAALQRQIWQIANDVRGAVDGWDFKQYVLGTLFYRFISENFAGYIEGGDESINYAKLDDAVAPRNYAAPEAIRVLPRFVVELPQAGRGGGITWVILPCGNAYFGH